MNVLPSLFEQACVEHGWSRPADFLRAFQTTADLLGEPVSMTDRQLRRWRHPVPPAPRVRAWRVLHAMFGMSPELLGFPGPPPGATVGLAPSPTQKGATVDRRAFLWDSAGSVAAAALPAHTRPLSPTGTSGSVGTVHLLELREGLAALFALDDAYGGNDVRSLAIRHLRRIRRIINTSSYPETIGRQLQLLAGEAAEHCGWLSYDADDQEAARRYWGEAMTTATVLRDIHLEVLVCSSLSLQASHEGRPRDALDLARAAQERAGQLGSHTLMSIVAAREARALSLMNDGKAANGRLSEAIRLVDKSGAGRPAPEWAAFHGRPELDFAQGLVYSEVGNHGAAVHFLRAALVHQDRTYGRNRALYRLTLANALVRSGEVDEGAAHAVESLEHLEEVESGRVTRKLEEVTGLLRSQDADSARTAVDELTEYAQTKGAA